MLKKLIIGILGFSVAIVIFLGAFPSLLSSSWGPGIVEKVARLGLSGTLRVQSLDVSWLGPLDVKGLSLQDTNGEEIAKVEKIRAQTSLWHLLKNRFQFERIDVHSPVIRVVSEEDASTNIHRIIGSSSKTEKQEEVREDWQYFLPFQGLLQLHDGMVSFEGQEAEPLKVSQLNVEVRVPSFLEGAQVQFRGVAEKGGQRGDFNTAFSVKGFDSEGMLSISRQSFQEKIFPRQMEASLSTSINSLPVELFDQLLSITDPSLKGILLSTFGEEANLQMDGSLREQEVKLQLAVKASHFQGTLGVYGEGKQLSLEKGGSFTAHVTPELVEKLSQLIQVPLSFRLSQPSTCKLIIDELSAPVSPPSSAFMSSVFSAHLIFPRVSCVSLKTGRKFQAERLVLQFESPRLSEGFSYTLSARMDQGLREGSLYSEGHVSDLVNSEGVLNLSSSTGKWKLDLEDFDVELVDELSWGEGELPKIFGEQASLKFEGTLRAERAEILGKLETDLLFAPKLRFSWDHAERQMWLTAKASIKNAALPFSRLFGDEFSVRLDARHGPSLKQWSDIESASIQWSSPKLDLKANGELYGEKKFSLAAPAQIEYDLDPELAKDLFGDGEKLDLLSQTSKIKLLVHPFEMQLFENFLQGIRLSGELEVAEFVVPTDYFPGQLGDLIFQKISLPWTFDVQEKSVEMNCFAETFSEHAKSSKKGSLRWNLSAKNCLKSSPFSLDYKNAEIAFDLRLLDTFFAQGDHSEGVSVDDLHIELQTPELERSVSFEVNGGGSWVQLDNEPEEWGLTLSGELLNTLEKRFISGPVRVRLKGKTLKFYLDSFVQDGALTLRRPLQGELLASHGIGRAFLKYLNPLVQTASDAESPVSFEVDHEGFLFPLEPFDTKEIKVKKASVDLSKMSVEKGGPLDSVLEILQLKKLRQVDNLNVWFTPLYFSILDGLVKYERMDALIDEQYPIAIWGELHLPKYDLDMVLALSSESLKHALGIQVADASYMLQVPMKGNLLKPRIDAKKALARIGQLLAQSQVGGDAASIIGGVLGMVAKKDYEPAIPSSTVSPLPWEGEISEKRRQEEYEKNRKSKDLPFLDLFSPPPRNRSD